MLFSMVRDGSSGTSPFAFEHLLHSNITEGYSWVGVSKLVLSSLKAWLYSDSTINLTQVVPTLCEAF